MGANYGAILTAWGVAGVAGPLFAARVKDATGSYAGALLPVACMLLGAVLLPMILRKPKPSSSVPRGGQIKSLPVIVGGAAGRPDWGQVSSGPGRKARRGPPRPWCGP